MKIALVVLVALSSIASAQVKEAPVKEAKAVSEDVAIAAKLTKIREARNAELCLAAKLPATCTDADLKAAPAVPGSVAPVGTIYATDVEFKEAVIVPVAVKERDEALVQKGAEALMAAYIGADHPTRVAACVALGVKDAETVCQ